MANEIPTKYDDTIDSRQVIEAIETLTATIEDETTDDEDRSQAREDLAVLQALADEASQYAADWQYGETLIRDSYFEDYAQELAEDCGMLKDSASWPYTCIDWERAARELQQDYTSVSFDGIDYWIR